MSITQRVRPALLALLTLTTTAVAATLVVAPSEATTTTTGTTTTTTGTTTATTGTTTTGTTGPVPTMSMSLTSPPQTTIFDPTTPLSTSVTTSTSCYHPPAFTSYPAGAAVASFTFNDGLVPTNFYADAGVTMSTVPGVGTNGSAALSVSGLSEAAGIGLGVNPNSFGSFQATAMVRAGASGEATRVVLVPVSNGTAGQVVVQGTTFSIVDATASPGRTTADWFCNGRMTGGVLPGSLALRFLALLPCGATGSAPSSLIIDDVQVTAVGGGGSGTYGGGWGSYATMPGCPVTTTTPATTQPATCTVSAASVAAWPGGMHGAVTVTNATSDAVKNWTLTGTMVAGQTLQSGWPASFSSSGTTIKAVAPAWAATLAAGASHRLGFVLAGPSTLPTGWSLNGSKCAVR